MISTTTKLFQILQNSVEEARDKRESILNAVKNNNNNKRN